MNTVMQYEQQQSFHEHLQGRGLYDADLNVWIDYNKQLVTFPMWGVDGQLVGYQKYDWRAAKLRSNQGKYFTWIGETHKPLGFWGMEYVQSPMRHHTPLLVLEGVWDAIRAISVGYRACAILTATPNKAFVHWFKLLTIDQYVVSIRDNDGLNTCSEALDKLTHHGYTVEGAKDLGEMNRERAGQWLRKTVPLFV